MLLSLTLSFTLSLLFLPHPASGEPDGSPVVLILVEDNLTWERIAGEPGLATVFENGAAASMSTAQGRAPDDPRMGYVMIGAGARADTSVLPERLPEDRRNISGSFRGPASTIRPGALGDALAKAGMRTVAVGERAALVVMDSKGEVPKVYGSGKPIPKVREALEKGAGLVAVEASGPRETARIAKVAREAEAGVAIAAPNAPPASANLTPFVLSGPDGVLYSPGTRTAGLISNEDVAPTLLERLNVPVPPRISGQAAEVRAGSVERVDRLQQRISFVEEERGMVWTLLVGAALATFALGAVFEGREGIRWAMLFPAALPLGALIPAAFPVTNAVLVAALGTLVAGGATVLLRKFTRSPLAAMAWILLLTAVIICADAVLGGIAMRYSVLGYYPAYGARFYGIGNEYSAVLAGTMSVAAGLFVAWRRRLLRIVPVAGVVAVLAIGLPAMGADVGGSLALGLGLGATVGLLRGEKLPGLVLWTGGGLSVAVMVFLLSGIFSPDTSHGARAASGEIGLYEIAFRKLILSLHHLLNPLWTLLLAAGIVVVLAGWRRVRGTARGNAVASGILGASIAAAASGALNDSGIIAALFALAYPVTVCLVILLSKEHTPRRAPR